MTAPQLPPGQQLVARGKWPIVGEREPLVLPLTELRVTGSVARPTTFSLDALRALPQVRRLIEIHCVTRWSKLDAVFAGVPLTTLLELVVPTNEAKFVAFVAHTGRRHSTTLTLADARELDVLIGLQVDDQPLPREHGGPIRSVTPGRYFYKSVKWLAEIELLPHERLGYWEASAGYHNRADPWQEQRFVASGLTRQEAARLLSSADLSGLELLSLEAADHDLAGLKARRAILRNAHFTGSQLSKADFELANLSNARFARCDLRDASFRGADLEGADFTEANLRGADLRGASVFGATFDRASIDSRTRIDRSSLDGLAPAQVENWQRSIVTFD